MMKALLALLLIVGSTTANAQLGEEQKFDEFTGVYKINRQAAVASIKKMKVQDGDLLNPPVYEYRLTLSIDDKDVNINSALNVEEDGTLSDYIGEDCDDPGCTKSDFHITVTKNADGRAVIDIEQDWFRYDDGDVPEGEGRREFKGRRVHAGLEKPSQSETPLRSEQLKQKVFDTLQNAVIDAYYGGYDVSSTPQETPMTVYKTASNNDVLNAMYIFTNAKIKSRNGYPDAMVECTTVLTKDAVAWKAVATKCDHSLSGEERNQRY
jgi:hypothetical protein